MSVKTSLCGVYYSYFVLRTRIEYMCTWFLHVHMDETNQPLKPQSKTGFPADCALIHGNRGAWGRHALKQQGSSTLLQVELQIPIIWQTGNRIPQAKASVTCTSYLILVTPFFFPCTLYSARTGGVSGDVASRGDRQSVRSSCKSKHANEKRRDTHGSGTGAAGIVCRAHAM